MSSELPPVVAYLRCPHCGFSLGPAPAAKPEQNWSGVICEQGHHFDVAKQGYLSLLGKKSRTDTGDSVEMVTARANFLKTGLYQPISDAVTAVAHEYRGSHRLSIEIGAGTGYYLGRVLDSRQQDHGIAVDSSVRAARRAAKAHPRMFSVVADAWDALPIRSHSAGVLLSVFAPRSVGEICRLLAPGGVFIAVTPEPSHLTELVSQFGMLTVDAGKAEKLGRDFAAELEVVSAVSTTFEMALDPVMVRDLVMMGPSARHVDPESFERQWRALPQAISVTGAVTVTVLKNRTVSGSART
ncbi:23S rRNA methyltransferase [Nakamurella antarctica]|uniref:23S rRNA methyltransferase n=1 Tax=Nakamurella antarctica TaxID=1902245 RepID=A0A3G8ZSW1_9ACTN|nr:23S rRNA methyltransferase [Nakamurella antarctica]AZI57146.1 23S rRNA methyltransferase [Nakamurella antarctica]